MKVGMPLAKLVGEHEYLFAAEKDYDFVSMEEMVLWPGFKNIMTMIANDLNRAKLDGNHLIRVRVDCHAQSNDEVI